MTLPIPHLLQCGVFFTAITALSGFGAESTTLALWTFEEWTEELERSQQVGPISPEIGSGAAYGRHEDPETIWSRPTGNGSGQALNSNRWRVGDFYEFSVSTLGFHSIQFEWHMTRSDTGPKEWLLGYSTDGVSFTDHSAFTLEARGWGNGSTSLASIYTADFTEITELEDQPNVFFRIMAAVDTELEGPFATNGTARIDNVAITAIPEPATVTLISGLAVAALVGVRVAGRRRNHRPNKIYSSNLCHGGHRADETSRPDGLTKPNGSALGLRKV